jgi:uncharacterized membrane protein
MKARISTQRPFDWKELIPLTVIVLLFAAAFWLYPTMPARMPVHWDAHGDIDGYGNRFIGLFLIPIITAAIYLLFAFLPYIAVHRDNIRSFYFFFFAFKVVFVGFMAALFVITLLPNFGLTFNMNYLIIPLMAILIYAAGVLMKHSKRNFFIGFRTQWTLSSDSVWQRSNRLAGRGFQVIAVLMVISLIVQQYTFIIMMVMLLGFVAFLVPYSYVLYRNEEKDNAHKKIEITKDKKR